jgi:hypothetical protein
LVERGLCLTEKRDALIKWPGYFFERLAHVEVPNVLNRSLYHVKLIYEPERALKAKAYLYLSHLPIKQSKPKAKVEESAPASDEQVTERNG